MSFAVGLANELARGIKERTETRNKYISEEMRLAKQVGIPARLDKLNKVNQSMGLIQDIRANVNGDLPDEFFLAVAGGKAGITLDELRALTTKSALQKTPIDNIDLQQIVSLNGFNYEAGLKSGLSELYGLTQQKIEQDPEPKNDNTFGKNLIMAGFALNPQQSAEDYLETASILGLPVNDVIAGIGRDKGTIQGFDQITGEGISSIGTQKSEEFIMQKDMLKERKLFQSTVSQALKIVAPGVLKDLRMTSDGDIESIELLSGLNLEGTNAEAYKDAVVLLKDSIFNAVTYQYLLINREFKGQRDDDFDRKVINDLSDKVKEVITEFSKENKKFLENSIPQKTFAQTSDGLTDALKQGLQQVNDSYLGTPKEVITTTEPPGDDTTKLLEELIQNFSNNNLTDKNWSNASYISELSAKDSVTETVRKVKKLLGTDENIKEFVDTYAGTTPGTKLGTAYKILAQSMKKPEKTTKTDEEIIEEIIQEFLQSKPFINISKSMEQFIETHGEDKVKEFAQKNEKVRELYDIYLKNKKQPKEKSKTEEYLKKEKEYKEIISNKDYKKEPVPRKPSSKSIFSTTEERKLWDKYFGDTHSSNGNPKGMFNTGGLMSRRG
tara:strand:+ start:2137 stop:3969 length:1833 start_codon:yes stop_codon:yes gene_type:complete